MTSLSIRLSKLERARPTRDPHQLDFDALTDADLDRIEYIVTHAPKVGDNFDYEKMSEDDLRFIASLPRMDN